MCDLQNGHGFKASEWASEGLPIIRIQNLNGAEEFNYFAGEPEERWIIRPGDLLYSWAGVKGKSFGPRIWSGQVGVLNQHIYKLLPKETVNKTWLFEVLNLVTHRIEKRAHGFKLELVHVRKADITDQLVAVPTINDQERLAAVSGEFHSTLESWRERIDAHRQLKRQLINELLDVADV